MVFTHLAPSQLRLKKGGRTHFLLPFKRRFHFYLFFGSLLFFGGREIFSNFSVLMDPSTVNEESRRSSDMSTKPPQIHDRDHVRQLRSTSNAIFLQKLELSPPMTSPPGKIHRFLVFFLELIDIYISVCGLMYEISCLLRCSFCAKMDGIS